MYWRRHWKLEDVPDAHLKYIYLPDGVLVSVRNRVDKVAYDCHGHNVDTAPRFQKYFYWGELLPVPKVQELIKQYPYKEND